MLSRFIALVSVLAIATLSACVMDTGELPAEPGEELSKELDEVIAAEASAALPADDFVLQEEAGEQVSEALESQDFGLAKVFRRKSSYDCVTVENTSPAGRRIRVTVRYNWAPGPPWHFHLDRTLYPGEELCTCVPDSFRLRVVIRAARRGDFAIRFSDECDD